MSIQSIAMQPSLATATIAISSTASPHAARPVADSELASSTVTPSTSSEFSPSNATEKNQQVEAAVKAVKDFIQPMAGNLEFIMDEETGDTIIKIVDSASGELIRQIPSKEMLEIAKALDRLQGLLVRQKA